MGQFTKNIQELNEQSFEDYCKSFSGQIVWLDTNENLLPSNLFEIVEINLNGWTKIKNIQTAEIIVIPGSKGGKIKFASPQDIVRWRNRG